MNFFTSFRDSAAAKPILERIHKRYVGDVNIMEFCGGHTVLVFKHGIRSVMPPNVRMLAGPGCPVCVTSNADLDKAIALAKLPDVIFTTYGDMLKVPGSRESLMQIKAQGYAVEIVYSTLDALQIARQNPGKHIVFFAIGFETTAPAAAAAILQAKAGGLKNFSVCSVMKLTVPGTKALLSMGEVKVDGIIGPGHVSTVIGSNAWKFIPEQYGVPVAISGFELLDILASIDAILHMLERKQSGVVNEYSRSVKPEGNTKAWDIVREVFDLDSATWRGFGAIPESGLKIREEYAEYDAERIFSFEAPPSVEHPACRCGEVLRGILEPHECEVFGTACTPDNPLGPCMVSSEGSCAAYFHFQHKLA